MRRLLSVILFLAASLVAVLLLSPESLLAASAPPADSWLVLLYFDADDEVLERDILTDCNEPELVGSAGQVTIVAEIDRHKRGRSFEEADYRGGCNWTSPRRYLIQKDPDGGSTHVAAKLIADLGELDLGDPKTLDDFVERAICIYPATKHAPIMSDHGMGWPGAGQRTNGPRTA